VVGAGGGVSAPAADDVPAEAADAVRGADGGGRGAGAEGPLDGQVALLEAAPLQQLVARQPLREVHLTVLEVLVHHLGRRREAAHPAGQSTRIRTPAHPKKEQLIPRRRLFARATRNSHPEGEITNARFAERPARERLFFLM